MNPYTIPDKDAEYWRLPQLIDILSESMDLFANEVKKYHAERNYRHVLFVGYNKAILTMKEIITLLNAGYPDGALARARNVYEQMCVMMFLEKRKNDGEFSDLIERYNADLYIRYYSNMILWHTYFQQEEHRKRCQNEMDQLLAQYRSGKKDPKYKPYWWAGKNSFNELSNEVDMQLMKILYNRACLATHAGAMGDFALLGRGENLEGNLLDSTETSKGFSVPLLLGFGSFAVLSQIVFSNLEIEAEKLWLLMEALIRYYQQEFAKEAQ